MFQAVLKNSRIKYGKKFLEFLKSPVQLLDKTPKPQNPLIHNLFQSEILIILYLTKMRVSRIFAIALISLLMFTTSDARRGGGGSRGGRSSSRGRSMSGYSYNRYSGIVIIAGPNGTYY